MVLPMAKRFGAGELYGHDFSQLSPEEIRKKSSASSSSIPCPFKAQKPRGIQPVCSKKGGVCSLRLFESTESGEVIVSGMPTITCPNRFLEGNVVTQWVGETLLGTRNPLVVSELPFLMETSATGLTSDSDAVGKIDQILVHLERGHLRWCAVEMQAVYFSGMSMENDFRIMRNWKGPGIPFPASQRRPDYRSSGPKRLMPQLQTKVPTISRWGKKMAVIIDQGFWESLGEMRETRELSNSEIVWFVVSLESSTSGNFSLRPAEAHFTTLAHAVEGLTGGTPMSQERFENQIRERLALDTARKGSFQ